MSVPVSYMCVCVCVCAMAVNSYTSVTKNGTPHPSLNDDIPYEAFQLIFYVVVVKIQ